MQRDIFENLSPLDHRYWQSNKEIFDGLSACLSEQALLRFYALVEVALIEAHLSMRGKTNTTYTELLNKVALELDAAEVYKEEEKTKHNMRALVNVIQRKLPPELQALVHLGATSFDILDTGRMLAIKTAMSEIVIPLLKKLVLELCRITENEAYTAQIGRTHGQHALPITFGFAIAEYVSRLGKSVLTIEKLNCELVGKLSGAVGAYNALGMIYVDPEAFEKKLLDNLGLVTSEHSTQIVEAEPLLRLFLEINNSFGIIAGLADDLRNLQRSEIAEVQEDFSADQIGSSTMPHKRNPWNSEHVKSLWKTFTPRVLTFFMDQISEHQRDLTNSASERFRAEFIAGFCAAANRMLQVTQSLHIDREKMLQNLHMSGGAVLAEPAYILLAECGFADGHEILRKFTLTAEREKLPLAQVIARDQAVSNVLNKKLAELGLPVLEKFFNEPALYCGRASAKALAISKKYRALMDGKK